MNPLNQAYQLFIDEVPELLQEIENGLLNLREDQSTAKIHGIMRSAHSIKGGAASVGLKGIRDIAHRLEDYLKVLYNEDLVIDTELEELFLQGYDSLAIPLREQLETGNFDRASAQNRANEVWQKLEEKLGNALKQVENYLPSSQDLGIDMVASIFEVDIAQEIRRLKGLVASPESFNPTQELQESLEILNGLAEFVNLSGFSLLINIAQQALQKHPDKAVTIAQLLFNDLDKSRDLVLNGDRTEGGNPCSALLTLADDTHGQIEIEDLTPYHQEKVTFSIDDPSYQFFLAEVPDLLHNLESGLLSVKEEKTIAKVNDMMRSAHSIKGGAASLGLDTIKNIAHKLEDYLKALFDESVIVDDELETYLLDGFDCLKNALQEQIDTHTTSPQWQESAETIWDSLAQKLGHIQVNDYLPSSADLGIDMVQSLFEVDITQVIEHLEASLNNLTIVELQSEVTLQIEMLIGFSEMTNLPGLRDIAETATLAIANYPHRIQQITFYLLQDLKKAQTQVLEGDRTIGGQASQPLQELAGLSNTLPQESTLDFSDIANAYLNELNQENIASPAENSPESPENIDFTQLIDENSIFDLEADNVDLSDVIDEVSLATEGPGEDEEPSGQDFEDLMEHNEEYMAENNLYGDLDAFMDNFAEINDDSAELEQQKELQAQSYKFFLEEAVDLIALIDNGLEDALATRDINQINEVARAAHSLKGGARSAGLEDLGNIALRVEKSLKALFNEEIPLDDERKAYIRQIYQLLRQPLVARLENQTFDEKTALDSANEMWAEFESQYAEAIAKSEEYLPSSSDLGVDIATSIFEVDVVEGINTLKEALSKGDESNLYDLLTMQIDVFSGFGEMLGLPGFVAICETTTKALQANPSRLLDIAQVFIDNLEIAQKLVMEGDRESGGEPSAPLLELAGENGEIQAFEDGVIAPLEPIEQPIDTSDQAYSFFVEEAPELLDIIENGLLTLRDDRSPAKIHEIMRAAHSLKGGSASVGLEAIKTVSHQLEDVFKVLYNPDIELDNQLEGLLLDGFDCLKNALLQQIETGSYNPQETLNTANEIWTQIHGRLGDALNRVDDYIPSSQELGVDIVQSMFEVDVQEEIDRLKQVINNPSGQPLAGELRATLEVFSGFGEMLALPGFAEIARLGLQAIDLNPHHASTIIQIIIQDADKARTLVLGGDRTTGGNPSPELIRLAESFISEEDSTDMNNFNDIFGEIADTTEQTFTILPEDKQTQTNVPSLDDVFNVNVNDQQIEAIRQAIAQEEDNEEIPNIEDIFASEFSQEEIDLLTKASELALEEDKTSTLPSLSEVFANTDISFLDQTSPETEDNPPSLEDVFGNEDMSVINNPPEETDTDEIQDLSSLNDVFSSAEMASIEEMTEDDTPEDAQNIVLPSLSAVFSHVDMASLPQMTEDEPSQEEDNTDTPSLSEVFSNVDMASIDHIIDTSEEEELMELPSLSEVFSNVDLESIEPIDDDQIISKLTIHKQEQASRTPVKETIVLPESPTPQTVEEAIKSIGDVYQQLPSLQEDIGSNIGKGKEKSTEEKVIPPKTSTPSTTTKSNLTVRVDLERLERMNNLIGELSINRNGLSLQNDKLQISVKELLERFVRFQQMANNLRDLSDKMLISPEKFGRMNRQKSNSLNLPVFNEDSEMSLTSAFDSLEMDSYDNMYYVVQGLIEQIIQLEEAVDDIALYARQSGQTVENQRQMLNRLRDELMWARMLPLGEVLNRFPRLLRDLSVKYNKKVNLKLTGTNVLVDKAALEKLYDPLVHLIRNAFDHGIETPEVRKQRGKSETGIIEVKAYHQGNQTIIEVKDDGGGLNLNKIGQKAIERKLLTPEQLAVTTKDNLLDLIFEPGFSTAPSVTEISGRGVGLDIVRSQLRSLKGTISVDSSPGEGTTFTLRLPLTLTIDKLLVLSSQSHFYALPSDNIEEIIVPDNQQLKTSANKRFLHFENKVIPIYPLNDLLEYRCYVAENPSISQALEVLPTPKEWNKPLLMMSLGQELFAIEVDHLVSEQELVIKPFGSALTAPSYIYGCTILGDGTLIPVINTATLLANFLEEMNPGATLARKSIAVASHQKSTATPVNVYQAASVLVVDDSAAMRRTLALSLEKAGYRVIQAKDGKEALEQLQQSSNVSLVICDIEMPNMNGFEFLGQRRRYPELSKIPVAMLTSRSNDKHRKLATHLGANAYFTKPYIEQKFLQSIKALVDQKSPGNTLTPC